MPSSFALAHAGPDSRPLRRLGSWQRWPQPDAVVGLPSADRPQSTIKFPLDIRSERLVARTDTAQTWHRAGLHRLGPTRIWHRSSIVRRPDDARSLQFGRPLFRICQAGRCGAPQRNERHVRRRTGTVQGMRTRGPVWDGRAIFGLSHRPATYRSQRAAAETPRDLSAVLAMVGPDSHPRNGDE